MICFLVTLSDQHSKLHLKTIINWFQQLVAFLDTKHTLLRKTWSKLHFRFRPKLIARVVWFNTRLNCSDKAHNFRFRPTLSKSTCCPNSSQVESNLTKIKPSLNSNSTQRSLSFTWGESQQSLHSKYIQHFSRKSRQSTLHSNQTRSLTHDSPQELIFGQFYRFNKQILNWFEVQIHG